MVGWAVAIAGNIHKGDQTAIGIFFLQKINFPEAQGTLAVVQQLDLPRGGCSGDWVGGGGVSGHGKMKVIGGFISLCHYTQPPMGSF